MKPGIILAVGADIKNRLLLAAGKGMKFGPDLGDLGVAGNYAEFKDCILRITKNKKVDILAYDAHPGYFSSAYARQNEINARQLISVQHQHAHIASVIYEHGLKQPVIGVSFDGTGYGLDGNIWGGEFLLVKGAGFKRLGHLKYQRMPGGEKVVKEPWRMVLSILGKRGADILKKPAKVEIKAVLGMLSKNINSPLTSSAGRLFDAAAALLGLCEMAEHEAQGPIKLEALAQPDCQGSYNFAISKENGYYIVDPAGIFEGMLKDLKRKEPVKVIAAKVHNAMADVIVTMVKKLSAASGLREVALSGGVFQNKLLKNGVLARLRSAGYKVYINEKFPVNDLNIALGQYYVSSCSSKN